MKKHLLTFLVFLSAAIPGNADNFSCAQCFGLDATLTFDVGGGYRNDTLKWKAFPVENIEISQEWQNISLGIIETNAEVLACDHLLAQFDFDYGWFCNSGKQTLKAFQDDYLEFDIKAPVKGNVYDLSGGLGYRFNIDCLRMTLAPLAGYAYSQQRFKNRKYHDHLDHSQESFFAHNAYNYRWKGPWLGVAFAYSPCWPWSLYFDYSFHWLHFRGTVKENFLKKQPEVRLRSNQCYGNEFTVGSIYHFCDGWMAGLKFDYKDYFGNKGHWEPLVHGHVEESPLRKMRWNSYFITLDIGYTF